MPEPPGPPGLMNSGPRESPSAARFSLRSGWSYRRVGCSPLGRSPSRRRICPAPRSSPCPRCHHTDTTRPPGYRTPPTPPVCRAIPRVIRSRGMRAGSLRRGIGGQSRHHRPRQQRTPHQGSSQGPFPPPTGMSRTRISFPHCHWFPFSFSRLDDLLAGSPSCLGVVTIPEPDARIAPGRTRHGPLIPWA